MKRHKTSDTTCRYERKIHYTITLKTVLSSFDAVKLCNQANDTVLKQIAELIKNGHKSGEYDILLLGLNYTVKFQMI